MDSKDKIGIGIWAYGICLNEGNLLVIQKGTGPYIVILNKLLVGGIHSWK